jgi:transposase-like protein
MSMLKKLREEASSFKADKAGRRLFSTEFKKRVVKLIKSNGYGVVDVSEAISVHNTLVYRWVRAHEGKVHVGKVKYGANGHRFTLSTKIEVVETVKAGYSIDEVTEKFGVGKSTVYSWISDYDKGLYNLDNVVQVVRKEIETYEVLLAEIGELEEELRLKKNKAREALEREYQEKLKKINA